MNYSCLAYKEKRKEEKLIQFISMAKGIAILCVVAGHSFNPASDRNRIIFSL